VSPITPVRTGFTGQGGTVLQSRSQADHPTASVDGPQVKPPQWLKLVRRGEVFSGFCSDDGKHWAAAGSATNVLNAKLSAGLALTAHNNSLLNSTLFESVTVNGQPVK
jgi:hypothetical protein